MEDGGRRMETVRKRMRDEDGECEEYEEEEEK